MNLPWKRYLLMLCWAIMSGTFHLHFNGLAREVRSSIANTLEVRLSCANPSIWTLTHIFKLILKDVITIQKVKPEVIIMKLISFIPNALFCYHFMHFFTWYNVLMSFSRMNTIIILDAILWKIWAFQSIVHGYFVICFNSCVEKWNLCIVYY